MARTLLEGAEDVREVAPSLTHLERRRRAKGKSDSVDAVAIARVVAADEALPSARRAAVLSDLKLLVDYRDQLVRARTQVANRVHAHLVVIRPGLREGGAQPASEAPRGKGPFAHQPGPQPRSSARWERCRGSGPRRRSLRCQGPRLWSHPPVRPTGTG